MVGGGYYRKCGTTATSADVTISATDTSYDDYCYEYEKSETENKYNKLILKEELNIPSFKIVKKLHNIKRVRNFVANKQRNFNIRNAL